VTTSLPLYPSGASSTGIVYGITVKLLVVSFVDPERGLVNMSPAFLEMTSARTSL